MWSAGNFLTRENTLRLTVIACEVFYRELCRLAAESPHRVDCVFMQKGLHDLPAGDMARRLQEQIDRRGPESCDRIALAYALCNNGVSGLRASRIPLVLPRAHDCITLFLGDRTRYREYFAAHPGTYFLTSGWIERGTVSEDLKEFSVQHRTGLDLSFEQLARTYGEENARYLLQRLSDGLKHYRRFTFIDTGTDPEGRFERFARRRAQERQWQFERLKGDLRLLSRLVNGPWNEEDFLTVPPDWVICPTYDERIVKAAPPPPSAGSLPPEDSLNAE